MGFMLCINELNYDLYKSRIDESVYSLDREFRCIYSTKYNQDRMFVPLRIR